MPTPLPPITRRWALCLALSGSVYRWKKDYLASLDASASRHFSRPPARLVRPPWAPRPAVAASTQPLPGVVIGDHAAADPGGGGDSVFPAFPDALPHVVRTGRRRQRRGDGTMGGAGLLRARAQSACRSQALRSAARRRAAARFPSAKRAAWDRPQHRRRDSQPGLERPLSDPRRQRQARADALSRHRWLSGSASGGEAAMGDGACPCRCRSRWAHG